MPFAPYLANSKFKQKETPVEAALHEEKVRDLKLLRGRKNPVAWLKGSLRVESLDNTSVLRVSLAEGSAEEQAIIVNAVVKAYCHVVTTEVRKDLTEMIDRLAERQVQRMKAIAELEGKLTKLNGLTTKNEVEARRIAETQQSLARRLADVQEDIRKVEARIKELQAKLREPPVRVIEWAGNGTPN